MSVPGSIEADVHTKVRGTSLIGTYEIEGDTVLLTSADFGEASSKLNDAAPEEVAERLLRDLAEAAMARPGLHIPTDEEAKGSSPVI